MLKTTLKVLVILAGVLICIQATSVLLYCGDATTPRVNESLDGDHQVTVSKMLPYLQAYDGDIFGYTYGLGGSMDGPVTIEGKTAMLSQNVCVIFIDWPHEAQGGLTGAIGGIIGTPVIGFPEAVSYVPQLAHQFAKLLLALNAAGVKMDRFCLIGFSLGAPLMCEVGRYVNATGNATISRLTAIEPANYVNNFTSVKNVDPSCADYVLGLHTNGGFYSTDNAVGAADVWFNPSTYPTQPNCTANSPLSLLNFNNDTLCNHSRGALYFFESLQYRTIICFGGASREAAFAGQLNGQTFTLGNVSETTPRGSYIAYTNGAPLYGKGAAGSHP